MDMLLDRYISIKIVTSSGLVSSTSIAKHGKYDFLPTGLANLHVLSQKDHWNHFLFSSIIKYLDIIPYEETEVFDTSLISAKIESRAFPLKKSLKYLIESYEAIFPSRLIKIVFHGACCHTSTLLRLQMVLPQWPCLLASSISIPEVDVSVDLRGKLHLSEARNEFEDLLDEMVPLHMPLVYLEGYKQARDAALIYFPNRPSMIFTQNSYDSNDMFKLWAAEKVHGGAKLLIGQHGGFMGTSLCPQLEDHQIAIADKSKSPKCK